MQQDNIIKKISPIQIVNSQRENQQTLQQIKESGDPALAEQLIQINKKLINQQQLKLDSEPQLILYYFSHIQQFHFPTLIKLNISKNHIKSIEDLTHGNFSNLQCLYIQINQIENIEPLTRMNCLHLDEIRIFRNKISNLMPITKLNTFSLLRLETQENYIYDLGFLRKLETPKIIRIDIIIGYQISVFSYLIQCQVFNFSDYIKTSSQTQKNTKKELWLIRRRAASSDLCEPTLLRSLFQYIQLNI